MRKDKPKCLIILGPTASGKSDLAVRLAKKFKGEIISADSRQVYKRLNIGTGKITKKEMRGIPHHLLDVTDPKKQFTVSEYKTLADNSLRYIVANSKLPIIVGGTGFYIDALTCTANFSAVPPNPELRKKMMKKTEEELYKLIKKKDPARASSVDRNNKLRLVRALEIIEALGKVPKITDNQQQTAYEFIYIGLMPSDLDQRISERLMKRLPGMIREAKRLVKLKKLSYKRMHELGLEYRFLAKYLKGEMGKEEMGEKLNIAIRQYARRQMTWFKRNKNIKWFKPEEYKKIEEYVRRAMKESNPR